MTAMFNPIPNLQLESSCVMTTMFNSIPDLQSESRCVLTADACSGGAGGAFKKIFIAYKSRMVLKH